MQSHNALLMDIQKVLKKHRAWLSGSLKIRTLNSDKWDELTADCSVCDELDFGYAKDKSGPFLKFSIQEQPPKITFSARASKTVIMDKDHLLKDGILSPIDKKAFHNRREWNDHLKRNGCIELGTEANKLTGKKPLEGDFNCRKELSEVVERVSQKYGH